MINKQTCIQMTTRWYYPFKQREKAYKAGLGGLFNRALICDRLISEIRQVRKRIRKEKLCINRVKMKPLGLDETGDYFLTEWSLFEGIGRAVLPNFDRADSYFREQLKNYKYIT